VEEPGALLAVDQAANPTAQGQAVAGPAGAVGGLLPGGLVVDERHAGGLGFDRGTDACREDLARSDAVEAGEAVQGALDQVVEGYRLVGGDRSSLGQEQGRAQQLDGDRLRCHERLRCRGQEVRLQIRGELGEAAGGEELAAPVRPQTVDGGDRALAFEGALEDGDDPGVEAPCGTVEGDLQDGGCSAAVRGAQEESIGWPAGLARGVEDTVGAPGGEMAEVGRGRERAAPGLPFGVPSLGVAAGLAEGAEGVHQHLSQEAAEHAAGEVQGAARGSSGRQTELEAEVGGRSRLRRAARVHALLGVGVWHREGCYRGGGLPGGPLTSTPPSRSGGVGRVERDRCSPARAPVGLSAPISSLRLRLDSGDSAAIPHARPGPCGTGASPRPENRRQTGAPLSPSTAPPLRAGLPLTGISPGP